ncbi:hypothetical protein [Actibacterium sp. D379-3]
MTQPQNPDQTLVLEALKTGTLPTAFDSTPFARSLNARLIEVDLKGRIVMEFDIGADYTQGWG